MMQREYAIRDRSTGLNVFGPVLSDDARGFVRIAARYGWAFTESQVAPAVRAAERARSRTGFAIVVVKTGEEVWDWTLVN